MGWICLNPSIYIVVAGYYEDILYLAASRNAQLLLAPAIGELILLGATSKGDIAREQNAISGSPMVSRMRLTSLMMSLRSALFGSSGSPTSVLLKWMSDKCKNSMMQPLHQIGAAGNSLLLIGIASAIFVPYETATFHF